ncbi:acyl CoA binding protein [Rhypophila decipiens]|uniref:Acyl CoA binding protein n=1 Tax=Rhypophila decipiens TaxID=261697 RepID=A0AAN7B223_9PEZI|nr:acyl CoA binding protein [Rhypophila decipiens]
MSAPRSAAFEKAAEEVKRLTKPLPNEDKLELYGLYKHSIGEDWSKAPKPSPWDFKGKAKYAAWQKIYESGISAEEAQAKYVTKVEELKKNYGYDENKEPEVIGA